MKYKVISYKELVLEIPELKEKIEGKKIVPETIEIGLDIIENSKWFINNKLKFRQIFVLPMVNMEICYLFEKDLETPVSVEESKTTEPEKKRGNLQNLKQFKKSTDE